MVRAYSVDLLCLYLFLRVYQSLKSGMWNNSNSTFLRIYAYVVVKSDTI